MVLENTSEKWKKVVISICNIVEENVTLACDICGIQSSLVW